MRRHRGVGADGVEWLFPDAHAYVDARLINADGRPPKSRVRHPLRRRRDLFAEGKKEIVVRTGAGLKTCRLIARQGFTFEFEADMGPPELGGQLSIETPQVHASGTRVSRGSGTS